MIFGKRRSRRHPLAQAVVYMRAAVRVLDRHWYEIGPEPSFMDLARARAMEQILFRLAEAAGRVVTEMERRAARVR
jgi:hypothetical protein